MSEILSHPWLKRHLQQCLADIPIYFIAGIVELFYLSQDKSLSIHPFRGFILVFDVHMSSGMWWASYPAYAIVVASHPAEPAWSLLKTHLTWHKRIYLQNYFIYY